MSNVIDINFGQSEEKTGYLIDDRDGSVDGLYNGDLAAMKLEDGSVVVGTRADGCIEQATLISMKDMNEFCLMWLLIFDESVIKEKLD
jgi:hypothetical protein